VRTLERKIGAICRAVAVKVAEHMHQQPAVNCDDTVVAKDQSLTKTQNHTKSDDKAVVVDIPSQAEIAIPPEMPIIVDLIAVEDILGVSFHRNKVAPQCITIMVVSVHSSVA